MSERKFVGLDSLARFLENSKNIFASKIHTHTAEEVGADVAGSASAALALSQEYTDDKLATITTGDVVVKNAEHSSTADVANTATNAEHATSADEATKATQDASGNVITEVYETKVDAQAKFDEAKKYVDDNKTVIDTTLSVEGQAADAKAVGESLKPLGIPFSSVAVIEDESSPDRVKVDLKLIAESTTSVKYYIDFKCTCISLYYGDEYLTEFYDGIVPYEFEDFIVKNNFNETGWETNTMSVQLRDTEIVVLKGYDNSVWIDEDWSGRLVKDNKVLKNANSNSEENTYEPTEDYHLATKKYVDENHTWENISDKPFYYSEGNGVLFKYSEETGLATVVGDKTYSYDDFLALFGEYDSGYVDYVAVNGIAYYSLRVNKGWHDSSSQDITVRLCDGLGDSLGELCTISEEESMNIVKVDAIKKVLGYDNIDLNDGDEFTLYFPTVNDDVKYENKKTIDEHVIPDVFGKVKTVNGEEPDENGNVDLDLKETIIECLPVTRIDELVPGYFKMAIVNILDLEYRKVYCLSSDDFNKMSDVEEYLIQFVVVCEDGTEKQIISNQPYRSFVSVYGIMSDGTLSFYPDRTLNTIYFIDISDLTTADNVKYEIKYNNLYLGTSNMYEYTPTDNYHPATKKYVDDSVKTNNSAIESIQTSLEDYYLKTEADALHTEILEHVDTEIANLVGTAPETLDTIEELATAFEENSEVVEVLNQAIANKADVAHVHGWDEIENKPFGIAEEYICENLTSNDFGNYRYDNELEATRWAHNLSDDEYQLILSNVDTKPLYYRVTHNGTLYEGIVSEYKVDENGNLIATEWLAQDSRIGFKAENNILYYYIGAYEWADVDFNLYLMGDKEYINEESIPNTIARVDDVNSKFDEEIGMETLATTATTVKGAINEVNMALNSFEEATDADIDSLFNV